MPTTQPLVTLEAARTVVAGALAHARDNDLPRLADGRELRRHYFTRESARAQIAQRAALR